MPITNSVGTIKVIDVRGSDRDIAENANASYMNPTDYPEEYMRRVIKRMLVGGHSSPFFQETIKVRIDMPIFTARQLIRHRVGMELNELSRRYRGTDQVPLEMFLPDVFLSSDNPTNKQQAGEPLPKHKQSLAQGLVQHAYKQAELMMQALEDLGVSKQQARMVMPVGSMTTWVATVSVAWVMRVWKDRVHEAAQPEIRDLVMQFDPIMQQAFPITWSIFRSISA